MQSSAAQNGTDAIASTVERLMKSKLDTAVASVHTSVCALPPMRRTDQPVSKPPTVDATPTPAPYAELRRGPQDRISREYT
eukprot:3166393-Pleurochrysis_carterae.AAC.2